MITDYISFKILGSDMSRKELFRHVLQHDQKDRLIPRIGEFIEYDRQIYKVIEVKYDYDYDNITVTVKKHNP